MNIQCSINKKSYPADEVITGRELRKSLFDFIREKYPDFSDSSNISLEALQDMRRQYIEELLQKEMGDLSDVEKDVVNSIMGNEILSENLDKDEDVDLTLGAKLADRVASFGGSWTFIGIFFIFLLGWMIINVVLLRNKAYDPYPFILLNLILSCLAAIQAPVIMMSQNRQEAKDRTRSVHDYKVNLKAELEIRLLHEKIDHLLLEQNKRLLELQSTQNEMIANLGKTFMGGNK